MSNIVISNATPIISLCSVGYEFILKELFHNVLIPQAVDIELRSLDKPGSRFSHLEWVVGLAMEVHSKLGYGFLEKVYENAMMVLFEKQQTYTWQSFLISVKKVFNTKDLFNRIIIIYSCKFVFIRG